MSLRADAMLLQKMVKKENGAQGFNFPLPKLTEAYPFEVIGEHREDWDVRLKADWIAAHPQGGLRP